METSAPPLMSRLVLILLFLSGFAVCAVTATEGTHWRPGFLYTRTRGRCTPQYWSSGKEAWPRMVPQTSTVAKVFGSRAAERFRSEMTLSEATAGEDGADKVFDALLKQTSAALVNSYARRGFPYTAWEVKTLLIQALVSEEAAARQAAHFSVANEACN